jgi:predicted nucleic acid-binding Zn finger protein
MSVVRQFQGSKGNIYETRIGKDHQVYCTCPGWKFSKKKPKTCKHIKQMMGISSSSQDSDYDSDTQQAKKGRRGTRSRSRSR